MKKKLTKLLIGAFALAMAVVQPAAALPDTSPLNTIVTADAATATPGKVKLKSIKAVTNNKIQINWNKTSGATQYRIYYKKYGTSKWTFLSTVNTNVTSYTHASSAKYPIKCGQKYTYTVRAYNSTTKKWGSYDTKGLTTRTAPTTVALKDAKRNSNNTVTVSWNKAYGGNYYRVYRKTPGSGWKLIATVKSNVLSYTDQNPAKGQKNTYTVRMYNSAMKVAGGYRVAGLSVTIPKTNTTAVGTPELTSIKSAAYNKITVNWKKAANATNYRIYYKTPGSSWKLIATVGSNVTSYTHTSSTRYPIRCGQKYTYTVRAYNSRTKKLGRYDTKGLTAYTVPSAVGLKAAVQNSDGTVTVSWNRAYGGNFYRVYRKTTSVPSWKLIDTVSSSVLSYTDKNPVVGEKNTYTIRMYNSVMNVTGGYDANGVSVTIPEKEPEVTPTPDPEEPEMSLDEMAQEIIMLTNEERAKKGAAPLEYSPTLNYLAWIRTARLPVTGSTEGILGVHENLFINTNVTSPENIVNNWMNIPEYRDAILNPDNCVTAVSVYKASDGKTYWVQLISDRPGYLTSVIYHVTLNANGGTCKANSFMVLMGFDVEQSKLPIPTREGYTFKGWAFPESDNPFISFSIVSDVTICAIWEPNS
ncbi:MAG TPA: InlB B-repeat-containing protein [Candidatus Blautia excrementipullorum]|nr:InlB B-repeat-containing protein [Candidatus Blautia excrementipullorum]